MENNIEKILPIVTWLTNKYTSKESSSVSYETAQMLMEAVIYSIKECLNQNKSGLMVTEFSLTERQAYDRGYDLILEKVRRAKSLYHIIISDFEDYGCKNYRDTIIKGIPGFLVKYNPRFCPQNIILTLDYPTLNGQGDLEGIDLIYEYLLNIRKEQRFLSKLDKWMIVKILQEAQEEYEELYLDNICYSVLWEVVNRMLFEDSLKGVTLEELEKKVKSCIHFFIKGSVGEEEDDYFSRPSHDFAVRVMNQRVKYL